MQRPITGTRLRLILLILPALQAISAGSSLPAAQPGAPMLEQSELFVSGTEGYNTFRIPSLIVTPRGTVLAFAEGRKRSAADDGDVDLVWRRSTDGGRSWSPIRLLYEEGGDAPITIGNPCPVIDQETGDIVLPFCRNNTDVFITRSRDDGQTWSPPVEITGQVKERDWSWYATGPGIGIQLQRGERRGRLVIPCDHRVRGDTLGSYSHVIYSDDHGATWKIGGSAAYGTNECQMIERVDGTLLLNMRRAENNEGSNRAVATSADAGLTWTPVRYDETLVTPRCQASLIRYPSPGAGDPPRVLFSSPFHTRGRHRLTARLSEDDGRTWEHSRVIHPGRAAYSCLGVLPDGTILCLYEGGREHYKEAIRLARFPLSWLQAGD